MLFCSGIDEPFIMFVLAKATFTQKCIHTENLLDASAVLEGTGCARSVVTT